MVVVEDVGVGSDDEEKDEDDDVPSFAPPPD